MVYSYTNRSGFTFFDSARDPGQLAVIQSVLRWDLAVFGSLVLGKLEDRWDLSALEACRVRGDCEKCRDLSSSATIVGWILDLKHTPTTSSAVRSVDPCSCFATGHHKLTDGAFYSVTILQSLFRILKVLTEFMNIHYT